MTKERLTELFKNRNETLCVCVGSWKAYNECNNHGLGTYFNGSFYLDFTKLESVEEFDEVLDALGWSKEEQEELFVQDYISKDIKLGNCDYINPRQLLQTILDNEVDLEQDGAKISAIMEYNSCDFEEALESLTDFDFYEGKTAEEYEEELFYDSYGEDYFDKMGWVGNYINIDFEAMARDDDSITEVQNGVLVHY